MTLVCDFCSSPPPDDEAALCPCGGKYVATSVLHARHTAEVDAIDAAFERYQAAKAEPTYTAGTLFRRQAS